MLVEGDGEWWGKDQSNEVEYSKKLKLDWWDHNKYSFRDSLMIKYLKKSLALDKESIFQLSHV